MKEPSVFKCKHCGAPLGASDGLSLRYTVTDERTGEVINIAFDEKPVSPRCGKCRRKRQWSPEKRAEARAA